MTDNGSLIELIDDLPCYVARAGEGTYECWLETPCPACSLRSIVQHHRLEQLKRVPNLVAIILWEITTTHCDVTWQEANRLAVADDEAGLDGWRKAVDWHMQKAREITDLLDESDEKRFYAVKNGNCGLSSGYSVERQYCITCEQLFDVTSDTGFQCSNCLCGATEPPANTLEIPSLFEKYREEKGKWMLANQRYALDADFTERAERHAWEATHKPVFVDIENASWSIIRLWEKLGTITWRNMAEVCANEWGLKWK